MQNIFDFTSREPITTMIIAAAVVCVLAAFAIARRRRRIRAQRDAELPPLVFAVHDRTVTDLRPAGFRGHTPQREAEPRRDAAPRADATSTAPPRWPTEGERSAAAQRPTSGDAPVRVPRYEEPGGSRGSSSETTRRR